MRASLVTYVLGVMLSGGGMALYRTAKRTPGKYNNQKIVAIGLIGLGATTVLASLNMPYEQSTGNKSVMIVYYNGSVNCDDITIYTLRGCPWCDKAKARLEKAGRKFTEVEYISQYGDEPPVMPDGQVPTTFPQVWVNGVNMGGFAELNTWIDTCENA